MRIILSPAKKMNVDEDTLPVRGLPVFLEETQKLADWMRGLSREELKAVWKCNDRLAAVNYGRHQHMDLLRALTPAVLSYEGLAYQHMAPAVFDGECLEYIEKHLRILSGFYGLLRPFDGVRPYRLEMQAKIACGGCRTLYEFWGDRIARRLFAETDCIVDLASREYSRCISGYLPEGTRYVTFVFGELSDGRVKEKGTYCKIARGEMVRYMAEHKIGKPEDCKGFRLFGFRCSEALSGENRYIFLR